MQEPMTTGPVLDLPPQALDHLGEALRAYHALSSPVLQRRAQRAGAATYLHGLLLALPRTSIAPMLWALEGPKAQAVRTTQGFRSAGAWEDEGLRHRHWQEVDTALGEDDGVLTLDGSAGLHQGRAAVGVKRQDGGAVGKRAHGPAGVGVGEASRTGSTLWERRLSVPQAWVEDEASAERRRRCGGPAAPPCKTKPTLGGARLQAVPHAHTLRARGVTCDEACGRAPRLLDHLAGLGLWSWAEVPHETQVWRQRPATAVPPWAGQGRTPTCPRVLAGAAPLAEGAQWAAALPADRGTQHTIQAGSQGPRVAHCAALRVSAVREGWPGPEVWLVLRRHRLTGAWKTSRSHAPIDTPLATRVRLSGMRWPIETCCEDGTH